MSRRVVGLDISKTSSSCEFSCRENQSSITVYADTANSREGGLFRAEERRLRGRLDR